jgi:hypothetical protein
MMVTIFVVATAVAVVALKWGSGSFTTSPTTTTQELYHSSEPPILGFELVSVSVPDEYPGWAPRLVRGEYTRGRIIADGQEFIVVMEEWRNDDGHIVERLTIKDVAFIDTFVNFELSGPFGARSKGQSIILDSDVYHFLFTKTETVTPPPSPK